MGFVSPRYLYAFEMYEKAKEEGRPLAGRGYRRRAVVHESDEDVEDKQVKPKTERVEQEVPTASTGHKAEPRLDSSDIEVLDMYMCTHNTL